MNQTNAQLSGLTFADFYALLRASDFGRELPPLEELLPVQRLEPPAGIHAPYLIYVADFQHQTLPFVSESAQQVLGRPAQWLREGGLARLFSLIHPDDEAISTQIGLDYLHVRDERVPLQRRSSHHWTIAVRVRHTDGHLLWLLVQYAPLYLTETGRVLYAIATATDATAFYKFQTPTGSVVYDDIEGHRRTVLLPVARHHEHHLSQRELEILSWVARGRTSAEIGRELYISKATVDTHRRNILAKTGFTNSVELTNLALSMGL